MTDKKIDTLLADIDQLLVNRESHELNYGNISEFQDACVIAIETMFEKRTSDKTLRMSNIGRKDRQLWYDINYKGNLDTKLEGKDVIKFLYGNLVEALLVFLIKEAGHSVTHEQLEVEVDGIKGHIDGLVDEELADIKSASSFGFKKFKDGSLLNGDGDPFGYVGQLSGYHKGVSNKIKCGDRAHFIAMNKVDGSLATLTLEGMELEDSSIRIKHIKEVVANKDKPERCYEPTKEGAKGNLALPFACNYCAYKDNCWQDACDGVGIRSFQYSQSVKKFVKITEKGMPRVKEIV